MWDSTHTKTVENQTLVDQQNKSKRSKRPVETQFQTDVLKPRASSRLKTQTDAYNTLLSRANDERMRMNRQEKGTQAETLDFHPEVQQPKHHTMINHHQQTSQTNLDTHVSNP